MRNKILDILLPPPCYVEPVDTTGFIPGFGLYYRLRCIYNRQKEPKEEVIIIDLDE